MVRNGGVAAAVLAVLAAAAPALPGGDAPPDASALLGALRSGDPARRREALEAVLLRVREMPAGEAERLRGPLVDLLPVEREAVTRALAIRALGRLGGAAAAEPLLRALAVEEEPAPQAALVEAFADLPAEAVARPLSRLAFSDPDPRVGALAAQALGRVPGEGALRALLALSGTTRPWPVQAAVVLSLGLRDAPEAVDRALAALRAGDPAVSAAAREAGAALLGEDLGPDPEEWDARWAESRAGWKRGIPLRPPGEVQEAPAVSAPAPAPESRSVARFYDIPVLGGRVAFVLDCSQSMWGPKMEAAQAEAGAAVKGLRSGQRFGVVLFNERAWTWREDLVPASPALKWAFVRTLPDLPTKSYTNIHDSLERAFGWVGEGRWAVADPPGLDEVFFLTDGLPNRGRLKDPDGIAAAARGWNARARVRLHCVAVGERSAQDLLRRLAEENGGAFVRRP